MIRQNSIPQVRRVVLVPAAGLASGRGDELIRRYRLARLRLEGRDACAARPEASARAG
jgi:hypothetical protein